MPWQSPSIHVNWGPYDKPDPTEQKAIVDLARAALGGQPGADGGTTDALITRRHAVEKIAQIFDIENVSAVLDAIDEEQKKAQADADERMVAQQKLMASSQPKGAEQNEQNPGLKQ